MWFDLALRNGHIHGLIAIIERDPQLVFREVWQGLMYGQAVKDQTVADSEVGADPLALLIFFF